MKSFNTYIYVVFLLSGIIKSLTLSINIPFDLTLMTGCYLSLVIISVFIKGKFSINHNIFISTLLLFTLYLVIAFNVLYKGNNALGWSKFLYSITNIIAFIFPVIYGLSKKVFYKSFILISLIFGVINLYVLNFLTYEMRIALEVNSVYLSIGLVLGFSIFLTMNYEKKYSLINLLFFPLLLLLVASSARGPLIFYFLTLITITSLYLPMNTFKFNKIKTLSYGITTLLLCILFYIYSESFEASEFLSQTTSRMSLLFAENKGESVTIRYFLFDKAIDMFSENLFFGNGFGTFGYFVYGEYLKLYPHNIILELVSEIGMLGFFIFSIFLISMFMGNFSNRLFYCVFLFSILNLMKSYSFQDLRIFFGLLSVSIVLFQKEKITIST